MGPHNDGTAPPAGVNWKIKLSYDGTPYHGWQVQPRLVTIQGVLAAAIKRVTTEHVLPQGSGRTDTGVHALEQVASFHLTSPIPAENLLRALNRTLPASIRILSAEAVGPDFHARHSAIGKTYEYRIFRGESCSPFLAPYVYALPWPLDIDAMREAARLVVGTYDFTSFAAMDPDAAHRQNGEPLSNVRTVFDSLWTDTLSSNGSSTESTPDAQILTYRIRGSGFLHHMVRNLVGTFLQAGRGRILPAHITEVLEARARCAAGPTAPARGLFLVSVNY